MLEVVADGDLDGGLSLDDIVRRGSVMLAFLRRHTCTSGIIPHAAFFTIVFFPSFANEKISGAKESDDGADDKDEEESVSHLLHKVSRCAPMCYKQLHIAIHILSAGAGAHQRHRQRAVQSAQLAQRRILDFMLHKSKSGFQTL
jgi:hypothetical protein